MIDSNKDVVIAVTIAGAVIRKSDKKSEEEELISSQLQQRPTA